MKLFRKYGNRREEIKRAKKEFFTRLFIVGLIVAFFSFAILLAQLQKIGGTSSEIVNQKLERSPEEIIAYQNTLRDELALLEMEIEQSIKEDDSLERSSALLIEAIDIQRDIISNRVGEIIPRSDTERLTYLKTTFDTLRGQRIYAESLLLETNAKKLYESGEYEEAIDALQTALDKQTQINNTYSLSPDRNVFRVNQIQSTLSIWATKPQAERVDELIADSKIALANFKFEQAVTLAQAALDIQEQLNQEYRGSVYASFGRLTKTRNHLIETSIAGPLYEAKQLHIDVDEALQKELINEAQVHIEQAIKIIDDLSSEYPEQARQLRDEKERHLEKRDTILSYPLFRSITKLDSELTFALKNRSISTAESILPELFRLTERIQTQYPKTSFKDKDLYGRIHKLYHIRDSLGQITSFVEDNLRPIKGFPNIRMFATETPQRLLDLLQIENPSILRNPNLPIDSISAREVELINKTLEWILQSEIRLPKKEEYLAALSNEDLTVLARSAWHSQNSNGESQPVGTSKPVNYFYDLLGNVSEWVTDPFGNIISIGGSSRDNPLRLSTVPETERSATERNRFVGFRIVRVVTP